MSSRFINGVLELVYFRTLTNSAYVFTQYDTLALLGLGLIRIGRLAVRRPRRN